MPLVHWIATLIGPYRKPLVGIALLSLAEVAFAALAPWPMKVVVDNVLSGMPLPARMASIAAPLHAASATGLLGLVLTAGFVLQLMTEAVEVAGSRLQARTSERLTLDVRARLFAHLQALGLRRHASLGAGDAVYRIASDAPFASTLVFAALVPLGTAVLTLAAMLAVLARIDRWLAAIAMGVVPFLFWFARLHLKPLGDRTARIKSMESALAERLYDAFAAIRLVKSFGREGYEHAQFQSRSTAIVAERLALKRQESIFRMAIATVAAAGTLSVVWIGGTHVLAGRMSVGTLLVVIFYLGAVYRPLSVIAHGTGTLQESLAGARRVHETMALIPEFVDVPAASSRSPLALPAPGHVRFERVSFSYEGHAPALDDLSFSVSPGEMVALVGLTGAGKSTVAALIPRFFDPDAGTVFVDGIDARAHDLRTLRERVSLVLQEPVLFKGTIADNIRYGRLEASDDDVRAAAAAAAASLFIERLPDGYDSQIGEGGIRLSGGERQQVCLARALLKRAPILLLDEPTSSLDAATESLVFASLRRLRGECTTIVIAHRLSAVHDADCIVLIDAGRVAATGRHDEVLAASDVYRRMWERFCAS